MTHIPSTYHVMGLMSGTSGDGLDMALCEFSEQAGRWQYHILDAITLPYPSEWARQLGELDILPARELWRVHVQFGRYMGEAVQVFMHGQTAHPMLISSHGHTVFHRPDLGYTLQIGDGASLAAITGLPVVCDFRSGDVARGGQGAPLVPIGDELLFGEYSACVNLGGFANLSYQTGNQRRAFDICPANKVLNRCANKIGKAFDDGGVIARNGRLIPGLLGQLNALDYYHQVGARSLGQEWLDSHFYPILETGTGAIPDILHTLSEHVGMQVGHALAPASEGKVLLTGGGARNTYLVERIQAYCHHEIVVPGPILVDFKEALVFALMGLLRYLERLNCYGSYTGARGDSCLGTVYLP